MFSGQREFRGIIFSCTLNKISDLLSLFPKNVIAQKLDPIGEPQPTFEVIHSYYYSKENYTSLLDSDNKLEKIRVQIGRKEMYQYNFYAAKWQPRNIPVFILAVPFTHMAVDMFKVLEEKLHGYGRKYKKLDLDEFLITLRKRNKVSACITATAVHFRVSGTDTVSSAKMSGIDVVSSEFYKRMTKTLHGITITPRIIRFRYDDKATRFSIETNKHGSFWFSIHKRGANMPWLLNVLRILEEGKLLIDVKAYPLRTGLLKEEANE